MRTLIVIFLAVTLSSSLFGHIFPKYNIKVTGDVITVLFDDNAGNATTRAILSDISGVVYRAVSGKSGSPLSIDCRGLRDGEYAVRLSYNGMTTESKIHYAGQ